MEPSLIGWEWLDFCRQIAEKYGGRNGAQPYRLGMGDEYPCATHFRGAAMEPSLIGWEWAEIDVQIAEMRRAAMEPSLIGWEWPASHATTRASIFEPQWSPALSAGNGIRRWCPPTS